MRHDTNRFDMDDQGRLIALVVRGETFVGLGEAARAADIDEGTILRWCVFDGLNHFTADHQLFVSKNDAMRIATRRREIRRGMLDL